MLRAKQTLKFSHPWAHTLQGMARQCATAAHTQVWPTKPACSSSAPHIYAHVMRMLVIVHAGSSDTPLHSRCKQALTHPKPWIPSHLHKTSQAATRCLTLTLAYTAFFQPLRSSSTWPPGLPLPSKHMPLIRAHLKCVQQTSGDSVGARQQRRLCVQLMSTLTPSGSSELAT